VLVLEQYRIAIIIPAYNESETISQVVRSVIEYGDVIVVDDASTDDTKKNACKEGALVVSHSDNLGYDAALNTGFREADKKMFFAVVTFDADGQHPAKALKKYKHQLLVNKVDLVLGVRPNTARFSEWVFRLYTKMKFKWNDPLCGMKGYSMKMYRDKGVFDSYNSIGTELALFGVTKGYKYCEINLPIFKRLDKPRFSSVIKSNILILKALYNFIIINK
jgi:glycosyltransferase involved in cell wall biosynthesis